MLADRGHELGHRLEPEAGDEARRPQHAQRVVGERDVGRERRAQPALREVDRAVERVDEQRVGQAQRHRVDREVAAREIGLDVVAEHDLGLAALGVVHVGAERRDLALDAVDDRADRPEARADEHDAVADRPQQRLDRVRAGRRSRGRTRAWRTLAPEERVAHASHPTR